MMRKLLPAFLAVMTLMLAQGVSGVEAKSGPVKVVYHLTDDQIATMAMYNIANHLAADPDAKIVVVALARGVKAFVFGAQDANGKTFAEWIEKLGARGVEFRVCKNSLDAFRIAVTDLTEKVQVVPSGVAEVARLQAREGYVYIRP